MCNKSLHESLYGKQKDKADGLRSSCRKCTADAEARRAKVKREVEKMRARRTMTKHQAARNAAIESSFGMGAPGSYNI